MGESFTGGCMGDLAGEDGGKMLGTGGGMGFWGGMDGIVRGLLMRYGR